MFYRFQFVLTGSSLHLDERGRIRMIIFIWKHGNLRLREFIDFPILHKLVSELRLRAQQWHDLPFYPKKWGRSSICGSILPHSGQGGHTHLQVDLLKSRNGVTDTAWHKTPEAWGSPNTHQEHPGLLDFHELLFHILHLKSIASDPPGQEKEEELTD